MLKKCVLTILELNWNQRLGHKKTKLNICHHNAHVVHTTAKQIISRRRKNENVFKMSKDEKCTCKACKNTVFIFKYANLWGFCCRRRRGCLSSLFSNGYASETTRENRHLSNDYVAIIASCSHSMYMLRRKP